VRRLLTAPATHNALERAEETLSARPLTRLFVRDRDAVRPIAVRQADRFEARDDYVAVFSAGKSFLLNVSLHKLEERLPRELFVRIHRSHIINLDRIAAIHSYDAARMMVEDGGWSAHSGEPERYPAAARAHDLNCLPRMSSCMSETPGTHVVNPMASLR
jgi:DNA-binding LytR/AlgR family response regulator